MKKTVSKTCPIEQLRSHLKALEDKSKNLHDQITELSRTPGSLKNNEAAIQKLKREKMPITAGIDQTKTRIAEIEAEQAKPKPSAQVAEALVTAAEPAKPEQRELEAA